MCFEHCKTLLVCVPLLIGCTRYRNDIEYDHTVEYSWTEPGVSGEFTLFEGVQWNPAISQSLQPVIDQSLVANRNVLDLFGGPGVIAVTCANESPRSVVVLAESTVAAACSRYNVAAHNQDSLVTVRLVDWYAVTAVPSSEKFDVVFGTLFRDESASPTKTLEQRIAFLLGCFNDNLELSGRAIAVCETKDVADQLQAAATTAGLQLEALSNATSQWPVFEIKRPAPTVPAPVNTLPSKN